jgi:hypothetical protein
MNALPSRLKSVPTFSTALNAPLKPSISRPATPSQGPSRTYARPQHTDLQSSGPLSDKSTSFLIRRVLCPPTADKSAPISDLLPPLTSSNEVDLQLYAFIAIVIREFVYTWYGKITPDQVFVEEVVRVIAHCTRGLEERIRKGVDLEGLVFDELPELLEAHVKGQFKKFCDLALLNKIWSVD